MQNYTMTLGVHETLNRATCRDGCSTMSAPFLDMNVQNILTQDVRWLGSGCIQLQLNVAARIQIYGVIVMNYHHTHYKASQLPVAWQSLVQHQQAPGSCQP